MRFEWDSRKSDRNLRKHGVDFETASIVFDDPMRVEVFDRHVDGEDRYHTVGAIEGVLLLLVVHTYRDSEEGEEVVRLISAREVEPHERRRYEQSDL